MGNPAPRGSSQPAVAVFELAPVEGEEIGAARAIRSAPAHRSVVALGVLAEGETPGSRAKRKDANAAENRLAWRNMSTSPKTPTPSEQTVNLEHRIYHKPCRWIKDQSDSAGRWHPRMFLSA
jgi:hypothetical protein